METVPTAWYYVGGFGALAWILFSIIAKMSAGRAQVALTASVGIFGIASGMIAGGWARRTFIINIAGWAASIHPAVTFVIFILLVIFIVGVTIAAIIPDGYSPAVAASFGIAIAWIFVPSFLAIGALPGTWGASITAASNNVTTTLMTLTAGAWG
jgi:hypothetical protein